MNCILDYSLSVYFICISCKISLVFRLVICANHPINSVAARAWVSRESRDPLVLIGTSANSLCLYRVAGSDGNLQLRRRFNVASSNLRIRANFCPLMSFRCGACIGKNFRQTEETLNQLGEERKEGGGYLVVEYFTHFGITHVILKSYVSGFVSFFQYPEVRIAVRICTISNAKEIGL